MNSRLVRKLRYFYDSPPLPVNPIQTATTTSWTHDIPNNVVQTWEINEFGRRHKKSLEEFRSRNPELNFILLTKDERDEFMEKFADSKISSLYFKSRFKPMQVDLFRYSYIFQNGGFYFDISMAVSKPIAEFLKADTTGIISHEKNNSVFSPPPAAFPRLKSPLKLFGIWGFGFTSGHPILRMVLEDIAERSESYSGHKFESPKAGIIALTGPAAFTSAIWKFFEKTSDETILQLENDFRGFGYRVSGAGFRHLQHPSYANEKNKSLFD